MIISQSLPGIKSFLRPIARSLEDVTPLIQWIAGFITHVRRMSASQAAEAIRTLSRHRANGARYLARPSAVNRLALNRLARRIIASERRRRGEWFFLIDSTFCGHQTERGENMFSCGNKSSRPRLSNRRQRKVHRRSCHGFVMGLLITPSGCRIPCFFSYLTRDYCAARDLPYRTQAELAAALIRELWLPASVHPIVLGDTAFDAKTVRAACRERGFHWITPVNPERVLEGPKPRARVSSLGALLKSRDLVAVRLTPGQGPLTAQRRAAPCRCGSRTHSRTFYVHGERRRVLHAGEVRLVFSTTVKPEAGRVVKIQKVLMTDAVSFSNRRVVEYYDVRWQIELMFKELKSVLGLDHYQFRSFAKVERFVAACLVTFLYLEWYRRRRMTDRGLVPRERRRCGSQRTYGLCRRIRLEAELNDVAYLARRCRTKTGLRQMRRLLERALPLEYRIIHAQKTAR
jgi:hypothetical protein